MLRPLRVAQAALPRLSRGIRHVASAREQWGGRLVLSEEVEYALEHGKPIVALESTIITHGMPHPTNLTTALSLEPILRSQGVTPATVSLHSGRVHVGLSQSQLEELADPDTADRGVRKVKVSRRDIAPTLAQKLIGGTTVAGTMYIAESVGIGMFVTGGIGGVHRGAERSMDVSADLIELGRTPMAVVCAGAKSILDIPRTLEVLETQGVCVATYGEKPDFPAFYTPSSGQMSPWSVKTHQDAASLIREGDFDPGLKYLADQEDVSLSLPGPLSTLLAVPIPSEHAVDGEKVQEAVEQAVRESIEIGIDKRGKEVTPWLLKRVGELSGGLALQLNVKLIENNARVGGAVAVELARLQAESREHASGSTYYAVPGGPDAPIISAVSTNTSSEISHRNDSPLPAPSVLIVGSAALDITSQSPIALAPGTTTPGQITLTPGGVGRNIAEAAQNLLSPGSVRLVSPVRQGDMVGRVTMQEMQELGLRTDGLISMQEEEMNGSGSAACSLTLGPEGDLMAGVADMGIVESLRPEDVGNAFSGAEDTRLIAFDCNPTLEVITEILTLAYDRGIDTFCDPTSTPKLPRLLPALASLLPAESTARRPLTHLSPNTLELSLIHSLLSDLTSAQGDIAWTYINSLNLLSDWRAKLETFARKNNLQWIVDEGIVQQSIGILPYVNSLWVKAGQRGLLHLRLSPIEPDKGTTSVSHRLGGVHEGRYLALTHYTAPTIKPEEVVSTTGAGDTLVGGLIAGLVGGKGKDEDWVRIALEGVGRSLRSRRAVG